MLVVLLSVNVSCLLRFVTRNHKMTLMKDSNSKRPIINFLRNVQNKTKKKLNKHLLKNLNEMKVENESLDAKLLDVNFIIDFLRHKNYVLDDKFECLEEELIASKYDMPISFNAKLGHILSSQKTYSDKCGLCFDKNASTSKTTAVKKRNISFAPPPPLSSSYLLMLFTLKLLIKTMIFFGR
jgi:hypothetical protein